MNYETYRKMRCTDAFVTKEDVERIIETSDCGVLNVLAGDLKTGRINYINLDLSVKASKKILEMESDSFSRKYAYGYLIDDEMLHGRPYRHLFEKALTEGLIPEFPLYHNSEDKELLAKYSRSPEDIDGLVRFMHERSRERYVLDDPLPMAKAMMMLERQDRVSQLKGISKLYNIYAGREYDRIMVKMLEGTPADAVSPDLLNFDEQKKLHMAIESFTGEDEHFWLLESAKNGNYYCVGSKVERRIPNIDPEWRADYLEAMKTIIKRGWTMYDDGNCFLYSAGVLPPELIDFAIDCFINPTIGEKGDKNYRRCNSRLLAIMIAKACFVTGRYEEAYHYALKGNDSLCPLVYTMLIDGLGVEKNRESAIKLISRYHSEGCDRFSTSDITIKNHSK